MGGMIIARKTSERAIRTDKEIWQAVITLAEESIDDLPFTAEDVVRRIGRSGSGTMITRDRGGLKHMLITKRSEFMEDIGRLVEEEKESSGEISQAFCRKLGFLIVIYHMLFALDIVRHSYYNSSILLDAVKVLINSKAYDLFCTGFYILLVDWYKDAGFTRDSVVDQYGYKIRALFLRYQVTRPDMSVKSRG